MELQEAREKSRASREANGPHQVLHQSWSSLCRGSWPILQTYPQLWASHLKSSTVSVRTHSVLTSPSVHSPNPSTSLSTTITLGNYLTSSILRLWTILWQALPYFWPDHCHHWYQYTALQKMWSSPSLILRWQFLWMAMRLANKCPRPLAYHLTFTQPLPSDGSSGTTCTDIRRSEEWGTSHGHPSQWITGEQDGLLYSTKFSWVFNFANFTNLSTNC